MSFLSPHILYAVPASFVLLLCVAVWEWRRSKSVRKIFSVSSSLFARRLIFKHALLFLALSLLFTALAQPILRQNESVRSFKDSYVMLLFDLSWSMEAKSFEDAPNALERSREIALSALPAFRGGHVGVYGFTDRFGSFADFTLEHRFVRETIKNVVRIESVMGSGSDIEKALTRAVQQFPEKNDKKKFIVLFSDGGEELSSDRAGRLERIITFLKEKNIMVVAIGVGDENGVVIGERFDKPVVAKLNEDVMRRIAEGTGGIYVREDGAKDLLNPAHPFFAQRLGSARSINSGVENVYHWFAAAALVPLWLLWFFFGSRSHKRNT